MRTFIKVYDFLGVDDKNNITKHVKFNYNRNLNQYIFTFPLVITEYFTRTKRIFVSVNNKEKIRKLFGI